MRLLSLARETGVLEGELPQALLGGPEPRCVDRERFDHPLISACIGIRIERLEHPGGNHRGIERNLRALNIELLGVDFGHSEVSCVEKLADALPTEEAQVRLVEEADPRVWEPSTEERESDASVCNVGNGDHHEPAWANVRAQPSERSERILQVLEHVGSDDDVEAVVAEFGLKVHHIEIADDRAFGVAAGLGGHVRIKLNRDHRAAALLQHSRHVTRGWTKFDLCFSRFSQLAPCCKNSFTIAGSNCLPAFACR